MSFVKEPDYSADALWSVWAIPVTVNVDDRALQPTENGDGPVISAAGLADASFLGALLTRPQSKSPAERSELLVNQVRDEGLNGEWATPLLRAIQRHRSENIRLLLEHGAHVNGVDMQSFKEHARHYRRVCINVERASLCNHFIPVDRADVGPVPLQTSPPYITAAELAERRDRRSRFWAEPHSTYISYSHFGAAMHSITMAATTTSAILDQVLEAGADCSFWKEQSLATTLPDEDSLSPSQLSTTTPLHTAIAAGKLDMIRALLDRGFNINVQALVIGCHALTPVQCAVLLGTEEACAVLKSHPNTDLSITTPILGVHALHFAAARYRLDLLQLFGVPISAVPATAIGHTLLHVACLPRDVQYIQLLSPKVLDSVHDVCQLPPTGPTQPDGDKECDPSGDLFASCSLWRETGTNVERREPDHFEQASKQTEMCMYLVQQLGSSQIATRDVYGNTPLHYLASVTATNTELITWMRGQDGGDFVWHSASNDWGHTPKDLLEDGEDAIKNPPVGYRGRGRGRKGPGMFNQGT